MTPIDQIRPPSSTQPGYRVQRKKRSTRDQNREQRSSQTEKGGDRKKDRSEHIDKLI